MIKFTFSGTSHGEGYRGTVTGLPNGFVIDQDAVNQQLQLRKCGSGRSARQQGEKDTVQFYGLVDGKVNGELSFFVANRLHSQKPPITALRSGHVDVVAMVKLGKDQIRFANETASARNSVCYVVLGAICRQLLQQKGVSIFSYTKQIGTVSCNDIATCRVDDDLNCPNLDVSKQMLQQINTARQLGNSLGGKTVVVAKGVPCGWGEWFPYESRLDGKLAGAFMSIPSVKAVEFGLGVGFAGLSGADASDTLEVTNGQIKYGTNNCGGIVGGVTNGGDVVCTLTVKPVPTVKGVKGVDCNTLQEVDAHYERADTCVVPNVGVIAENVMAIVLANYLVK